MSIFEPGKKYTTYRIDELLAMTHAMEFMVVSVGDSCITYRERGKRKERRLLLAPVPYQNARPKPFSGAVFEGWGQPIICDTDKAAPVVRGSKVMRGNALYNFIGSPDQVRQWIDKGQINPNFPKQHAVAITSDGTEHVVYPEIETSHAVIQKMKVRAGA